MVQCYFIQKKSKNTINKLYKNLSQEYPGSLSMPNSFPKVTKHRHCCLHRMTLRCNKQRDLNVPRDPQHPVLNLFEASPRQEWEH